MKVIGTREDRWGSAHYRGHGPILAMAANGINAVVSDFIPSGTTHVLTGTMNSVAFLARLIEARKRIGFKLVVDIDEHLGPLDELPWWRNEESEYYIGSAKGKHRLYHMQEADGLIFSSPITHGSLGRDKPSTVIPLRVSPCITSLLTGPERKPGKRLRVYMNLSPSRMQDAEMLGPVLDARQKKLEILISGPKPAWLANLNGALLNVPWTSFDDYWGLLQAFSPDVVLSPLSESVYNAAKGPTRFIDASLVGAFGIYSAVEPYESQAPIGYICGDVNDWEAALDSAIENREGIRERAKEAGEYVTTKLAASTVVNDYITFMEGL